MTVCELGCASSVVCAERFRTVARFFTAGAHTPAVLDGFYSRSDRSADHSDKGDLRGCCLVAWAGRQDPGFLHFFGLLCLGMPAALLAVSAPEYLYCARLVLAS